MYGPETEKHQEAQLSLLLLFPLQSFATLNPPASTPLHLNHQQWYQGQSDTSEQEERPGRRQSVNQRLNSSDTCRTDQAAHQVINGRCAGTSTGVEVDHQGAVDGKDSRGTVGDDILQDDRESEVCLQRGAVDSGADDKQSGDPPGVAHAGVLDGEVGVCLCCDARVEGEVVFHAVFALGAFVIEVH